MKKVSSQYVNEKRREYSLYTLQNRSLPSIADGLKSSGRRILWVGRNGVEQKSAALAGACMPLHPHDAPTDAVNTLASHYNNNVPLLEGIGAFGTRLEPLDYGSPRYTSVKVSEFTKDAVFRDIELIPMKRNYDNTQDEPIHFLPLIPIVLLNGISGVAIGFACEILPRALRDVIAEQIKHLEGTKSRKMPMVKLEPCDIEAYDTVQLDNGNTRWLFEGKVERINTTTVRINNLPYGMRHEKMINKLIQLIDDKHMVDYQDDSTDHINITCKFTRHALSNTTDDELVALLKLGVGINENINMINFDATTVISPTFNEVVSKFCDWRLTFYKIRYERLAGIVTEQIEKLEDILTAIANEAGSKATKTQSRDSFKTWLKSIKIRHLDYIASLPVYRFTKEEKTITEDKLKECNATLRGYNQLIKSPKKRKELYITELKEILKKHG